jgi:hypothetical protein
MLLSSTPDTRESTSKHKYSAVDMTGRAPTFDTKVTTAASSSAFKVVAFVVAQLY